jgi:release factor glutamine methyltransferase
LTDLANSTRRVDFGALSIAYDDRVLEPRGWTTAQSAWAAAMLPDLPPGPVLELCAGAGQIGLLAVRENDRYLVQVDLDPVACVYAASNAVWAGARARVESRCGPMEEVVTDTERFALVIADPPWVPSADVGRYPDDPVLAIDGGPDGMDLARRCVAIMSRHLMPEGAGLLQVGTRAQVGAVARYLAELEDSHLALGEVRSFERGCLVRMDRDERPDA